MLQQMRESMLHQILHVLVTSDRFCHLIGPNDVRYINSRLLLNQTFHIDKQAVDTSVVWISDIYLYVCRSK